MTSYTIETRERADGTVRYRCTVLLGDGKKNHPQRITLLHEKEAGRTMREKE